MTMLEAKKELEDALYNGNSLSYEAMVSCYVAIQNFLEGYCKKDVEIEFDVNEVEWLKG